MTIKIIHTEIVCDTPVEAAELLRIMRPTTTDQGTVNLTAIRPNKQLPDRIMQSAQDLSDFKAYQANGGDAGYMAFIMFERPHILGEMSDEEYRAAKNYK